MTSLENRLSDAAYDYKFLLNRGYSRDLALQAVTSRYLLSEKERLLLYRCIHSDIEIETIKKKESQDYREILIDGFNLAISIISASLGEAYMCDDGYIRDLSMGRFKKEKEMIVASLKLINEICISMGKLCTFVLDAQISKSGDMAKTVKLFGGSTILSKTVDSFLINAESAVASNDFVILMKAKRIVNILQNRIKVNSPFFSC